MSIKQERVLMFPSGPDLSFFYSNDGIQILLFYCAFHKHANSEVQKPTDDCVFHCRQAKKLYFNGFKRSWFVMCDWWISIPFVCFCVSRFVACDRNYD